MFEPRQVLNSVRFCSIKWLPPRWDACPWQGYISPSWSVNSLDLHVYIHWGGEGKVPCPRPQYNDPCQASNREQFIRSSASYKPYGNGIFTLHHLKDINMRLLNQFKALLHNKPLTWVFKLTLWKWLDPTVQDCLADLADPLIAWIKHPAFTDLLVIWHDPMVTKNLSRRKRNKPM